MGFKPTDYFAYDFANRRHIGPTAQEMAEMLETIGYDSLDDLIDATVPEAIRQKVPLDWGPAMTERDALYYMKEVAGKNKVLTSLIGQGYHGTRVPQSVGQLLCTLESGRDFGCQNFPRSFNSKFVF